MRIWKMEGGWIFGDCVRISLGGASLLVDNRV